MPSVNPRDPVTGREIITISAFGANIDFVVKATGFSGTALKNSTTNIDFPIGSEDRYINGVHLFLKNHAWDDVISGFQIVDVNGVIAIPNGGGATFPAGTVLNQFGFNWNVDDSQQDQGQNAFPYVAMIPANSYIRLVYVSTGLVDVSVKLNCLLHKKTS